MRKTETRHLKHVSYRPRTNTRYIDPKEKVKSLSLKVKLLRKQVNYWRTEKSSHDVEQQACIPALSLKLLGEYVDEGFEAMLAHDSLGQQERKGIQFVMESVRNILASKHKRLWGTKILLSCYIAMKKSSSSFKRMKELIVLPCNTTLINFGKEMGISHTHSGINLLRLHNVAQSYFENPQSSLMNKPGVDKQKLKRLLACGTCMDDEFSIHQHLYIRSGTDVIVGFSQDFVDLADLHAIEAILKHRKPKDSVVNNCLVILFQPFLSPIRIIVAYYTSPNAMTTSELVVAKTQSEYALSLVGFEVCLAVHDAALQNMSCDKLMREDIDPQISKPESFGRVTDPPHFSKRVLGCVQTTGREKPVVLTTVIEDFEQESSAVADAVVVCMNSGEGQQIVDEDVDQEQAADEEQQALDEEQQTVDGEHQTVDGEQQIVDEEQADGIPEADEEQQVPDVNQQAVDLSAKTADVIRLLQPPGCAPASVKTLLDVLEQDLMRNLREIRLLSRGDILPKSKLARMKVKPVFHVFSVDVLTALRKYFPGETGMIKLIEFGVTFVQLFMDRNCKIVLNNDIKKRYYDGISTVVTVEEWKSKLEDIATFVKEWREHAKANKTCLESCLPYCQVRDILQFYKVLPDVIKSFLLKCKDAGLEEVYFGICKILQYILEACFGFLRSMCGSGRKPIVSFLPDFLGIHDIHYGAVTAESLRSFNAEMRVWLQNKDTCMFQPMSGNVEPNLTAHILSKAKVLSLHNRELFNNVVACMENNRTNEQLRVFSEQLCEDIESQMMQWDMTDPSFNLRSINVNSNIVSRFFCHWKFFVMSFPEGMFQTVERSALVQTRSFMLMCMFSFVMHRALENFKKQNAYKELVAKQPKEISLKTWISEPNVQYIAGAALRAARVKLLYKSQEDRDDLEKVLTCFVDERGDIDSHLNSVIKEREIVRGKLLIPRLTVFIFFKRLWMFMSSRMEVFRFKKPSPYLLRNAIGDAVNPNGAIFGEFHKLITFLKADDTLNFPNVNDRVLTTLLECFVKYIGRTIAAERIKMYFQTKNVVKSKKKTSKKK